MSQCFVLKCTKKSSTSFVSQKVPLMEIPICDEHKTKIDEGKLWQVGIESDGKPVLYMGSDTDPLLDSFEIVNILAGSAEVSPKLQLKLKIIRDNNLFSDIKLLLSDKNIKDLTDSLENYIVE